MLVPIELDIDTFPNLNNPLVRGYMDSSIEMSEIHLRCILDAIEYAENIMYGKDN